MGVMFTGGRGCFSGGGRGLGVGVEAADGIRDLKG